MYSTILILHNILRWGVLLGGLYAITKSALGLIHKREYTSTQNLAHTLFVAFCHAQLLLGIILYMISPNVDAALANGFGAAMKDPYSRLIVLEHITINVIAIALIQVGRTLSKKATDAMVKHKKSLIFFSIGLLLILSRIPWQYSPLFRL
ncbi:hypothetical protein AEM51_01730 [Bacteroidetes bacterium UKL13-3]|jgi:hypothetical protein|nr:hypothetical protein AEM51_01730 [Bacteroidetes bacterium UKL13-3]HCP94015.1 hypothetical protein [Bacteroidota bacterium]